MPAKGDPASRIASENHAYNQLAFAWHISFVALPWSLGCRGIVNIYIYHTP